MGTLIDLLRQTFRWISRYPFSLVCLQGLDLISESAMMAWPYKETAPYTSIAVLFPLTWMLTSIGLAMTYVFIRDAESESQPSIRKSASHVGSRLILLFQSQAMVGLMVMLGLLVILPGIYFLAVYLFVPCLVMEGEPKSPFVYLTRSNKLVRPRLVKMIVLSIVVLALGLGMGELEDALFQTMNSTIAASGTQLFLSLLMSATLNTFVSVLFLLVRKT